jgi:hypothetical protein
MIRSILLLEPHYSGLGDLCNCVSDIYGSEVKVKGTPGKVGHHSACPYIPDLHESKARHAIFLLVGVARLVTLNR